MNPELTWRDVQHLTVRCAHVANLRAADWAVNGVGRNYSHSYGYGIMDASCMVRSIPEKLQMNTKMKIFWPFCHFAEELSIPFIYYVARP